MTQFDQDFVGGSITERVAKDVVNACQFMTHDRKGRLEMGDANQIAVEHRIQNRIQKGKPGGMRFGAGSEHTKHSGTIGGEGCAPGCVMDIWIRVTASAVSSYGA